MAKTDRPEAGKVYALTGKKGALTIHPAFKWTNYWGLELGPKTIAAGNTWAEAEVTDKLKTVTFITIDAAGTKTKEVEAAKLYNNLEGAK